MNMVHVAVATSTASGTKKKNTKNTSASGAKPPTHNNTTTNSNSTVLVQERTPTTNPNPSTALASTTTTLHQDAHAIKIKLEQEVIKLAALVAELNISYQQIEANINAHRNVLDATSKKRSFCLSANEFYNELERLEQLEADFKSSPKSTTFKSLATTLTGVATAEDREEEEQQQQIEPPTPSKTTTKEYEMTLYKKSCIQARKLHEEKNNVWLHLEASIQQREVLKPAVEERTRMLEVLKRATGSGGARGSSSSSSSHTGAASKSAPTAAATTTTDTTRTLLHARQLSCDDREQWQDSGTKSVDSSSIALTRAELNQIAQQYKEIPEWSKIITLCKLKIDIDQKILRGQQQPIEDRNLLYGGYNQLVDSYIAKGLEYLEIRNSVESQLGVKLTATQRKGIKLKLQRSSMHTGFQIE